MYIVISLAAKEEVDVEMPKICIRSSGQQRLPNLVAIRLKMIVNTGRSTQLICLHLLTSLQVLLVQIACKYH